MSSDVAIKVEGVSKCYQIFNKPSDRLKQIFGWSGRKYYRDFWAIKNVSFQLKKGETIGIIGRNGAGKSTLLLLIAGVLNLSAGSVQVNGRVAALLELGAGFNPEFTGRENARMTALIFGLSELEADEIIDEIIAFSEIGEFVDLPVKTYSSGMFVRLAFAVIAHIKADILIVDEALSVGDAKFQQKCNRFLEQFKVNGGSILFVSHDVLLVKAICDKVVYLKRSHDDYAVEFGEANTICTQYIEDLYAEDSLTLNKNSSTMVNDNQGQLTINEKPLRTFSSNLSITPNVAFSAFNVSGERFGSGDAVICNAEFINKDGHVINSLQLGDNAFLRVLIKVYSNINNPTLAIIIKDRTGQYLMSEGTAGNFNGLSLSMINGEAAEVVYEFTFPNLINGEYSLDLSLADGDILNHVQLDWIRDAIVLSVSKGRNVVGLVGFSNYNVRWSIFQQTLGSILD